MAILEFTVSNSKYEVDLFSKLTVSFFSAWLEDALNFSNFVRTWVSGLLYQTFKFCVLSQVTFAN